ncbi:GNAT family N-acetyltransferase [Candidatus Riflebacteria bacterium]
MSIDIVPYSKASNHVEIPHLYAQAFGETPWPLHWDEFDGFDPQSVFMAKDCSTGKTVGFVIGFRRDDFGYISVVAVIPAFRRRNIATALIKEAIEYLGSLQLTEIMIDVEVENYAAVEVYRKLGFEILRTFTE